ncbi:related to RNA binding motif protein [Ustilago bromivora]|uniref:Related to RNA binding motif protein n=1 Tax=Ustilago bromivora TaxID=307758 RepID=A0A1K0G3K1_9BASI|nr:related to RNA binding motif protein [Ustilago bromivora]
MTDLPPSAYIDRDDPKHEGSIQVGNREREYPARRRSRSPEASRSSDPHHRRPRDAQPSLEQPRPVPWKGLRLPNKDESLTVVSKADLLTPPSTSKHTASKLPTTAATKRMATDISKWNRKLAELHAGDPTDLISGRGFANASIASKQSSAEGSRHAPAQKPSDVSAGKDSSSLQPSPHITQMSEEELTTYDYKDQERVACLLCQRKFKVIDTLHKHVSQSQLHKDNLANLDACRLGVARKLEALSEAQSGTQAPKPAPIASSSTTTQSQQANLPPGYRDRASERRAVFGADTPSKSGTPSTKVFDGPKAVPAPVAREEPVHSAQEKPIESDNFGSKLLAMMGWTQGQGLGLKGEGRTDPVETKIYKPGAGLGSTAPTDTAAHEANLNAAPSRKSGSNVAFAGYLDRAKDCKYPPSPGSAHDFSGQLRSFHFKTLGARQRLAEHSQHPQQQQQ